MTLSKFLVSVFAVFVLSGCQKSGDQFVGKWSNQWMGGGLIISIERNGGSLLFKESTASNGNVVLMQEAKVEGDYLTVEGSGWFGKMTYIKDEDALALLGASPAAPLFKRLK